MPSTSSSLAYFMPTSSLSGSNVDIGAVEVAGILPLPSLSPKKLSLGKHPSQSQSVSLGHSTTVHVSGSGKLLDCHRPVELETAVEEDSDCY